MITRSSLQSQFIAEYRQKFQRPWNRVVYKVVTQDGLLDVRVSGGPFDVEHVGVFDGEELVAIMVIWPPEGILPYNHIGKTIVAPAYQGNRITRQLIEWWVQTRQKYLASDENQTYDGAGVWESMICRDPLLFFSLWHPDGKEEPIKMKRNRITPDPWCQQHTRLIARC